MARQWHDGGREAATHAAVPLDLRLDLLLHVERVTRIELALSAWESDRSGPLGPLTSYDRAPPVSVTDPSLPWLIAR